MKNHKKNTRKQKMVKNPNGLQGNSKYAKKIVHRKKYAASLGLSDMPWPVLNLQDK